MQNLSAQIRYIKYIVLQIFLEYIASYLFITFWKYKCIFQIHTFCLTINLLGRWVLQIYPLCINKETETQA